MRGICIMTWFHIYTSPKNVTYVTTNTESLYLILMTPHIYLINLNWILIRILKYILLKKSWEISILRCLSWICHMPHWLMTPLPSLWISHWLVKDDDHNLPTPLHRSRKILVRKNKQALHSTVCLRITNIFHLLQK